MKRGTFFSILLVLGIINTDAQGLLGKVKGAITNKIVVNRLQPRNFVYKKSGEFMELKKNKEKKTSLDKIIQIDTLFIEDPNMSVGQMCDFITAKGRSGKCYVKNGITYNPLNEVDNYLYSATKEKKFVRLSGIQGFQALNTGEYGYIHGSKLKGVILALSDAVCLDGEETGMCGFFAGSDIKEVLFTSNIKKIGKGAFRDCKYLKKVNFQDGCENVVIEPDAFAGCDALKTIRVPEGKAQDYINMGLSAELIVDGESTSENNTTSKTNNLDKIIELIKKNYKDQNHSKLYTKNEGEKMYEYEDEENIAYQGRACWKTDIQGVVFLDNGTVGFITAMTIDLIEPGGGHGRRVYKKGPDCKEMRYILVNDVIYKWSKDDYSDIEECLIYDSKNDVINEKNGSKIYKAKILK